MITAGMRAAQGREFDHRVSFPIGAAEVRRWAIAVHHPNLPPDRLWAAVDERELEVSEDFNPFAWISASPSLRDDPRVFDAGLIERRLGVEGPGARTMLNVGLTVEYGERMRVGDVITATSRVIRYEQKHGVPGEMLLTEVETLWRNQRDEQVKRTVFATLRY